MPGEHSPQVAVASYALLVAVAIAVVALALVGRAPAAPSADYRVQAAERLSSGNARAHPDLGLVALLDDGIGNAVSTGELSFTVDRRQLDPAALSGMRSAPEGTVIGWVATDITGGSRVQMPLRTSASTDAGETTVLAEGEVQPQFVQAVGPSVPVTLEIGPDNFVATANLQSVARRYQESTGRGLNFKFAGLYLFGSYSSPAGTGHLAQNPSEPTKLSLSVSARPCADSACGSLGPPVQDVVSGALPERVTVKAPAHALYGQPTTFTGRAAPGDSIQLAAVRAPGGQPRCGDGDPLCSPRFSPVYDLTDATARAGRNGRWMLHAALRSSLDEPVYPATDGYAAIAFKGVPLRRLLLRESPGGRFSIFARAGLRTVVALARPRIAANRVGSKLRILVSVPGAEPLVRLRLRFRGKLVARGKMSERGSFAATIGGVSGAGRVRADASVFGAHSSTASVEVG
jgi:hypothetical protein